MDRTVYLDECIARLKVAYYNGESINVKGDALLQLAEILEEWKEYNEHRGCNN